MQLNCSPQSSAERRSEFVDSLHEWAVFSLRSWWSSAKWWVPGVRCSLLEVHSSVLVAHFLFYLKRRQSRFQTQWRMRIGYGPRGCRIRMGITTLIVDEVLQFIWGRIKRIRWRIWWSSMGFYFVHKELQHPFTSLLSSPLSFQSNDEDKDPLWMRDTDNIKC